VSGKTPEFILKDGLGTAKYNLKTEVIDYPAAVPKDRLPVPASARVRKGLMVITKLPDEYVPGMSLSTFPGHTAMDAYNASPQIALGGHSPHDLVYGCGHLLESSTTVSVGLPPAGDCTDGNNEDDSGDVSKSRALPPTTISLNLPLQFNHCMIHQVGGKRHVALLPNRNQLQRYFMSTPGLGNA
jgi:hypothetical protein